MTSVDDYTLLGKIHRTAFDDPTDLIGGGLWPFNQRPPLAQRITIAARILEANEKNGRHIMLMAALADSGEVVGFSVLELKDDVGDPEKETGKTRKVGIDYDLWKRSKAEISSGRDRYMQGKDR